MSETVKVVNKVEELKKEKDGIEALGDLYRYSQSGDLASIPETDFSRFRWFGVYRQKPNESGHFMLRVRVPGGQLTPPQLAEIAALADQYGRGFGDITTRQTIQMHWLRLEHFRDVFDRLKAVGMSSQFACGDTPRNIVSCPLAGVLREEIIDATPQIEAVNQAYLAAGRELSNLPRKYKTALGGCHLHCHCPQINDLGFFGVRRANGQAGYGVVVGGGLSDTPHWAQPMHVFVPPGQVADVALAVAKVFRDHGYREKRNHARLKFLVADKGWEWTRDRIEEALGYRLERDESIGHPAAIHADHMGIGEQKDGNYFLGVPIERGRWTAQQMRTMARLADQYAVGAKRIRLTIKQNAVLLDVPKANLAPMAKALTDAGLEPAANPIRSLLVSCTGTEFCNLAVVETKQRAAAILRYLEKAVPLDRQVMISVTGCPNSCAQYQIADIGLSGIPVMDAVKKDEKGKPAKVDGFKVFLGARVGNDPRFGEVIVKKVAADRVHLALERLLKTYMAERIDADEPFATWVIRSEPEYLQRLISEPVTNLANQPLEA